MTEMYENPLSENKFPFKYYHTSNGEEVIGVRAPD